MRAVAETLREAGFEVDCNSGQLAERPLWVFSSGPVGDPGQPERPKWMEPPTIVRTVKRLGARDHVVFGGRLGPPTGLITLRGAAAALECGG